MAVLLPLRLGAVRICTASDWRTCHDDAVIQSVAAAPPMVLVPAPPEIPAGHWRQLISVLGDAVLVLLLGAAFPFAILAVGTPIALVLLVLIKIVERF